HEPETGRHRPRFLRRHPRRSHRLPSLGRRELGGPRGRDHRARGEGRGGPGQVPEGLEGPQALPAAASPAGAVSRHYPISPDLADRPCLVVGGGPVAETKVRGLLAAGARVTVGSPTLTPALATRAAEGHLAHEAGECALGDLGGAALAFAAPGDRAVSRAMRSEGQARGVWVNAADDAE